MDVCGGSTWKHPRRECQQEFGDLHAKDSFAQGAVAPTKKQGPARLRLIFTKGPQPTEILWADLGAVYNLQRIKPRVTINHEVHFVLRTGLPVVELIIRPGVIAPGAQVLGDQSFQCRPVNFSVGFQ